VSVGAAVVVVVGEVRPHSVLGSDEFWGANKLALVRCSEEPSGVLSLCEKLCPTLLVAKQAFLEALPERDLALITERNVRILAFLNQDSSEAAKRMLQLGCHGVMSCAFSPKLLRRAIPAILGGELWAPRVVLSEMLLHFLRAPGKKQGCLLTPREECVLELVTLGYKNSEIAAALFISHETVRWHKRRLNRKIGADRLLGTKPLRKLPATPVEALRPSKSSAMHS
jgi:DNA-binding NarL/FixJ family response regulator